MKNILVTGGCGFVGSNLVDKLIIQGYNVLVIDDLSAGKKEHCNPKAKYIFSDIINVFSQPLNELGVLRVIPKHLTTDLQNIDTIFHLAGLARIQPSFSRPCKTVQVNSYGTALICEYAKKISAKVIYAGSSTFYYDKYASPYTFSKWQGEQTLKMYSKIYDLDTAVARFFNVYGPRNPLIGKYTPVIAIFEEQMRSGDKLTIVGTGEQRRDFTHVDDICSGMIAMSKQSWSAEIFNLGTGVNYSINEIADCFGGPKQYIPLRKNEAEAIVADTAKTQELLGWKAERVLPDYIKEFLKNLNNEEQT